MADKDEIGKLEVSLRILGNEIVGLKMVVDDFKIKWLVYGVITLVALGWAASSFGPALFDMIAE
jgi:hypothetical protein|tara:strand:- start:323 stop:514 length:192 start_codon:yes stop_codon:yes gene_type:complete